MTSACPMYFGFILCIQNFKSSKCHNLRGCWSFFNKILLQWGLTVLQGLPVTNSVPCYQPWKGWFGLHNCVNPFHPQQNHFNKRLLPLPIYQHVGSPSSFTVLTPSRRCDNLHFSTMSPCNQVWLGNCQQDSRACLDRGYHSREAIAIQHLKNRHVEKTSFNRVATFHVILHLIIWFFKWFHYISTVLIGYYDYTQYGL